MKKILVLLFVLALAGCAAIVKVEGEQVVNNKLAVKLPSAWNRIAIHNQPYELWTQDGVSLDQLRFWAGVPAGKALVNTPYTPVGQKAPRVPTFVANMTPDQLVSLFEILFSTDGSQVAITRAEPATFAGERAVRFEFTVTKKSSELVHKGIGWATVRNNELYAATFTAPELAFYRRLLPKAESVIATARIKA